MRVFPGNTADPTAFVEAVEVVRDKFGLRELVMVGDRGMITSARIEALKDLGGTGWLTALRAPQIAALAADDGPLQRSLFDQQDLAEITHPDYPGERLVACRNPALAAERTRKRDALLEATDNALAPIAAAVRAGRLAGADQIGLRLGKVINKYKMAKHLDVAITDTTLAITRRQAQIEHEAGMDGIYLLRTSIPADQLDPAAVVSAYKNLIRRRCHQRRIIRTQCGHRGRTHRRTLGSPPAPGMPRPPPHHRATPLRDRAARVHHALQHPPPTPITPSAPARRHTPPPSTATIRTLRGDRLGGLVPRISAGRMTCPSSRHPQGVVAEHGGSMSPVDDQEAVERVRGGCRRRSVRQ